MKNRLARLSLTIVSTFVLLALIAPWIVPYRDQALGEPNVAERLLPPSLKHPFGTDHMGRDILSRMIYGARTSLFTAVSVVFLSALIGVPIGIAAGYAGGFLDNVLMRFTDVFLSFPPLLLALLIASTLGKGLFNAILALVITWWPWYARLVRSQALSIKSLAYVEAARAAGVSHFVIMFKHILPGCVAPLAVQCTMDMGSAILEAAALSFLGLGVQPPAPDWGLMISEGKAYFLNYWWVPTFPGVFMLLLVMAFNLLGDVFRELVDPRLRRRMLI
ncbi:MAG: Binding-protein-dependent transport systems inner membrane component [Thermotoga sp. 50_1627]|uniref:ABC transporter permease n=1 Tax=Pseudothermotoga sp. TaxID=2033661 RepID=UPI00076DE1DE|nr:MAG: Binding-protein-dependent transport systems inner membrane component [Thermotoga sp. 50_64]KUK24655.1 MAG: Binding-protein-dependent transport systems inner membrane component [Thermotoga sp. 50_1627]MBC7115806.1 ABC transporter permease [Pseudothermotoga sp.]HBT38929.1 D,D-dipeptide ABC transporter permease [Pseudothermotoga sp.]HCO97788.1 D,D-dipeptide ABC transporter permease [Pseudothermotoga sp.]